MRVPFRVPSSRRWARSRPATKRTSSGGRRAWHDRGSRGAFRRRCCGETSSSAAPTDVRHVLCGATLDDSCRRPVRCASVFRTADGLHRVRDFSLDLTPTCGLELDGAHAAPLAPGYRCGVAPRPGGLPPARPGPVSAACRQLEVPRSRARER